MRYVLKKDFAQFFKKNSKLVAGIFVVLLFYSIYAKYNYDSTKQVFVAILGLYMDKNSFSADMVVFFFHIVVFIYIVLYLFFSMFRGNIENLFLRLPMKKWFFYKQISIFLVTILLKSSFYIIFSIISGYFDFFHVLSYFCIDVIFVITIQELLMFLLFLFYKNKVFFLLSSLFLIGIFLIFHFPLMVLKIQKQYFFVAVYAVFAFLFFFINGVFAKKSSMHLFEGSR